MLAAGKSFPGPESKGGAGGGGSDGGGGGGTGMRDFGSTLPPESDTPLLDKSPAGCVDEEDTTLLKSCF